MLCIVIAQIRIKCKGKLLYFDFSCADIELRFFVYNLSNIDELTRLILHA